MILSSIQLPSGRWIQGIGGSSKPPFPSLSDIGHTAINFAMDTHQRVCSIDEIVMLDRHTFMQYNKIKLDHLMDGIAAFNVVASIDEIPITTNDNVGETDSEEFIDTFFDAKSDLEVDCQVILDEETLQTLMDADSHIDGNSFEPFEFHLLEPDRIVVDSVWETGDQHLLRLEQSSPQGLTEGNGPLNVVSSVPENITTKEVSAFLTFGDPSKGGNTNFENNY